MSRRRTRISALVVVAGVGAASFGVQSIVAAKPSPNRPQARPLTQKSACNKVNLSAAPAQPVNIRITTSRGNEAYASTFVMDGVAPATQTPNLGKWYTLSFTYVSGNAARLNSLLAGQADIVNTGGPGTWIAVNQGLPAKALASSVINKMGTTQNGWFMYRSEGTPTDALAFFKTLRGKTVAITAPNDNAQLYGSAMAVAGGFYPQSVKFVVMPFEAMAQAVERGQVDLAPSQEPDHTVQVRAGAKLRFFSGLVALDRLARGLKQHDVLSLFVGNDFAARNPQVVCAFLADYIKANNWLRGNPVKARRGFMERGLVIADSSIYLDPTFGKMPVPDPGMPVDVTGLKKYSKLGVQLGIVKKEEVPNWSQYVSRYANVQ